MDSELDTADWGKKRILDFNAERTQLVSFYLSNNIGAIDVKMDGSVLEEKSCLRMLRLTFTSKLDWCSYIASIAKSALIRSGKFISPEVALHLIQPCWGWCS